MNKNIKVSIILPNYNSEKYLIKTILIKMGTLEIMEEGMWQKL